VTPSIPSGADKSERAEAGELFTEFSNDGLTGFLGVSARALAIRKTLINSNIVLYNRLFFIAPSSRFATKVAPIGQMEWDWPGLKSIRRVDSPSASLLPCCARRMRRIFQGRIYP
jgi:hypothetical protein